MARHSVFALGLAAAGCLFGSVGCTSTSREDGASDGAAATPDSGSDTGEDASTTLCIAAGGQCQSPNTAGTCTTIVGPVQACNSDQPGGSFCCAVGPDARCTPKPSNYDQACTTDSECVAVHEGDSCSLCALNCTNTAISVSAEAQYMSDLVNTPAAISAQRMACTGDCTFQFGPCCRGGTCQMGGQCPGPALTCALGAACSNTQICTGGVAGCTSNCQCLDEKWQAPCPADLPQTGSACTPAGAECGYVTSTNACGADNCYCQSGAWNCEPSCIIANEDAGADAATGDAGTDAAADGGPADAGGG